MSLLYISWYLSLVDLQILVEMATGIGILKVGPTTTSLVEEFSKVVLDKFSAEILDLLES